MKKGKKGGRFKVERMLRREEKELSRELRYMSAENVANDFPDKASRKAMSALFRWLSLNSTVAWRLKSGNYTNNAMDGHKIRNLDKAVAIIIDDDKFNEAQKLLCPDIE